MAGTYQWDKICSGSVIARNASPERSKDAASPAGSPRTERATIQINTGPFVAQKETAVGSIPTSVPATWKVSAENTIRGFALTASSAARPPPRSCPSASHDPSISSASRLPNWARCPASSRACSNDNAWTGSNSARTTQNGGGEADRRGGIVRAGGPNGKPSNRSSTPTCRSSEAWLWESAPPAGAGGRCLSSSRSSPVHRHNADAQRGSNKRMIPGKANMSAAMKQRIQMDASQVEMACPERRHGSPQKNSDQTCPREFTWKNSQTSGDEMNRAFGRGESCQGARVASQPISELKTSKPRSPREEAELAQWHSNRRDNGGSVRANGIVFDVVETARAIAEATRSRPDFSPPRVAEDENEREALLAHFPLARRTENLVRARLVDPAITWSEVHEESIKSPSRPSSRIKSPTRPSSRHSSADCRMRRAASVSTFENARLHTSREASYEPWQLQPGSPAFIPPLQQPSTAQDWQKSTPQSRLPRQHFHQQLLQAKGQQPAVASHHPLGRSMSVDHFLGDGELSRMSTRASTGYQETEAEHLGPLQLRLLQQSLAPDKNKTWQKICSNHSGAIGDASSSASSSEVSRPSQGFSNLAVAPRDQDLLQRRLAEIAHRCELLQAQNEALHSENVMLRWEGRLTQECRSPRQECSSAADRARLPLGKAQVQQTAVAVSAPSAATSAATSKPNAMEVVLAKAEAASVAADEHAASAAVSLQRARVRAEAAAAAAAAAQEASAAAAAAASAARASPPRSPPRSPHQAASSARLRSDGSGGTGGQSDLDGIASTRSCSAGTAVVPSLPALPPSMSLDDTEYEMALAHSRTSCGRMLRMSRNASVGSMDATILEEAQELPPQQAHQRQHQAQPPAVVPVVQAATRAVVDMSPPASEQRRAPRYSPQPLQRLSLRHQARRRELQSPVQPARPRPPQRDQP